MPDHIGFMKYARENPTKRSIIDRIQDFKEFEKFLSTGKLQEQTARCMDCGIPYCHIFGCPVKNRIPDWNDMVYRGQWRRALDLLHSTNNFPEITGRICPELCEAACTLSINQPAVTIRHIELQIVERGFEEGWILPEPAPYDTRKKIAVIGSGPAGLAAAQQLARLGHRVVVFEKANKIGGLLRYGIPDFKLEKWVIERRLEQMKKEGVTFENEVNVGTDISVHYLKRTFDATVITTGSTTPRDIDIPGRQLQGIHFAMDFLTQQNKRVAGEQVSGDEEISAHNKNVVVIGGGDTGSDCIGTARRQGAKKITQIEILPKPPIEREPYNPWPTWPNIMRTSSSHEEGCDRSWGILTKEFIGEKGHIKKLRCVKLEWSNPDNNGHRQFKEILCSEFKIETDLVLLATGFIHVEHGSLITENHLQLDNRSNIIVNSDYMTSEPGVFAAGDCVMGASLVAKAIYQGRQAAEGVNLYLAAQ